MDSTGRRVGLAALLSVTAIALLVWGLGSSGQDGGGPTSCAELMPGCRAKRLPDVILRGGQSDGALHSVDGFALTDIISSDEALGRAGQQLGEAEPTSVRVVLGSADVWGDGDGLFYGIHWDGVCTPAYGAPRGAHIGCVATTLSIVIEAHTGAFVVAGS